LQQKVIDLAVEANTLIRNQSLRIDVSTVNVPIPTR
jgi:hypothetical protein